MKMGMRRMELVVRGGDHHDVKSKMKGKIKKRRKRTMKMTDALAFLYLLLYIRSIVICNNTRYLEIPDG